MARYSNDRSEVHLTTAKWILRYLKGMQDLAITCVKGESDELLGYSDADWAGDKDSCRSTSGHLFLLGEGAIIWSSRKQTSIALSTLEAKYIALCLATQEAVWIRQLFSELELDELCLKPTLIMGDN